MRYAVRSFYKFTPLIVSEALKSALLDYMNLHAIKGTIILANEGVNGTICAEESKSILFESFLMKALSLDGLRFQVSFCDFNPFDKTKVKLRPEIVTLGLTTIDPVNDTGMHVKPEDWNQLISEEDVIVIDSRNDYEVQLGTFKNAINPKTLNFRDFPDFVEKYLKDERHRKVAMFCTGGIRCEKSTAYLKEQGFEQVYQLDGGILNYCATIPVEESLWEGHCFVFDNRVAVDKTLQSLPVGSIDLEWKNKSRQGDIPDLPGPV